MIHHLPLSSLLLFGIGIAAIVPLKYVCRYVVQTPSRRDIAKPSLDFTWRRPERLALNLAVLGGLAALAIFIFTPAAARMFHSPQFWPLFICVIGLWALATVALGYQSGRVEPMVRGYYQEYERSTQPKRYWVSMAWNAFLGCMMLFGGLMWAGQARSEATQDRCFNADGAYSAREALTACNQLLDPNTRSKSVAREDALLGRGNAEARLNNKGSAIEDYSEVLRIQPDDVGALEIRGMIYDQQGEGDEAISDFSEAIRLNPKDAQLYFRRGYSYQHLLREPQKAIADYDAALRLKPEYLGPLAQRAYCYGMTGDFVAAVAGFTDVIRLRPKDAQLYIYRAVAYDRLGDADRAEQDRATALRLNRNIKEVMRASEEGE